MRSEEDGDQMVLLETIMAARLGTVEPSRFPSETFDLYSIPAFDQGEPELTRGSEIGSSKQIVRPEDVLLSKIVPHIRRAWVVAENRGHRMIASGEWIVFRSNQVEPKYLRQVITGDPFHREFMNTVAGVGGSLLRARPSHVARIKVPLPPLPEQRRIAAILDKAEVLRGQRKKALGLLDELNRSVFLEMFGDPEKQGWTMSTIGQVADESKGSIRTGPFGSQLLHEEFTESGIAVLGIDNAVTNTFTWSERRYISDGKFQQLKRYQVFAGDIVITIMGTCGRCAIVPDGIPKSINTKHLCCITLDQKKMLPIFMHSFFLLHLLARKYLGKKAKGAVMDGLNMGIIKEMPIPLPPLPLQQEFSRRVAAMEALKATHKQALARLDELFASLQHRAFRGELTSGMMESTSEGSTHAH